MNGDLMNGTGYEQMNSLPIEKRKKALAFSKAMNALAGYRMVNETAEALKRWSNGQGSFEQGYTEVLRKYNLLKTEKIYSRNAYCVDYHENIPTSIEENEDK